MQSVARSITPPGGRQLFEILVGEVDGGVNLRPPESGYYGMTKYLLKHDLVQRCPTSKGGDA